MTNLNCYVNQAAKAYQSGNYQQAGILYEKAIEDEPNCYMLHWQLGLVYFLQDQSEAAQLTWLTAMLNHGDEETAQTELLQTLEQAAFFHAQQEKLQLALRLRQQIHDLAPDNLHNLCGLLWLGIQTKDYHSDWLTDLDVAVQFHQSWQSLDGSILWQIAGDLLTVDCHNPELISVLKALLPVINTLNKVEQLTDRLLEQAVPLGYLRRQLRPAAALLEFAHQVNPQRLEVLNHLSGLYQEADLHQEAIATAHQYFDHVTTLPDRICATRHLVKSYAGTGGQWQKVQAFFAQQEQLILELLDEYPLDLSFSTVSQLRNTAYFAPYIRDAAQQNRKLHNRANQLCQANLQQHLREKLERYQNTHRNRLSQQQSRQRLKVGFISYGLKRHSVGWLARSLFQHHDRDRFAIQLYLIGQSEVSDPLKDWYIDQADKVTQSTDVGVLSTAIFEDEVDILIDLDSLTTDITCGVMALKPAPVQATWLGWDASGIPTIDYFIADPYVLPDSAQDYYQEQILRLPNTLIGVDGFDVGMPTVRRENLEIPTAAIVFYSVQKGYKRNEAILRLQLEIVKQVPDSYFCLKGSFDTTDLQTAIFQLADEVGVDRDRLKFLGVDALESTHRANMQMLADIVLDTYPYNGATTTMETLWLGIPLVTRVGEQFSARNSYTMLKNVGVEAGIAYSAEEYVEWGVRLGMDHELRQQVVWQLRESRRHAPLWNGRQFARDMEQAYEQMWANYVETQSQ